MNEYEHELATRAHEAQLHSLHIAESVELERLRPFMLLRPKMFPDGNQWCALYGDNIQDGVCGFGDTPHQASVDFDIQWLNARIQRRDAESPYECHDGRSCETEHPCAETCRRFREENTNTPSHD